jgi:hypothetical protein
MGIEIEGLAEARRLAVEFTGDDEDFARGLFGALDRIESDYLAAHSHDMIEVSWPDHVVVARFNSDATYR